MNPTTALENAVRGMSFDSPSAARSSLAAHPLAGDVLFDLMQKSGALAVHSDGRVSGVAKTVTAKTGVVESSSEWKDTWPRRTWIYSTLSEGGPQSLKTLRAWLKEDGQPCGHWITLHALWRMMKDGEVVKTDDGYGLSPASIAKNKIDEDRSAQDRLVMDEVLRTVGEPWPVEAVVAALRSRADHHWFDPDCALDSAFIDVLVQGAKRRGVL